ncbi:MAG: Trp family transcriptional regulator, partial [Verrucomicrobiota bacterium]
GARVALTQADAGLVCPHCRREYAEDEAADATATRQQALRAVLQWLATEDDIRRIGWRCVLASWFINGNETQQELASRLGVSGAAISKVVKAFRSEITLYLQANREP